MQAPGKATDPDLDLEVNLEPRDLPSHQPRHSCSPLGAEDLTRPMIPHMGLVCSEEERAGTVALGTVTLESSQGQLPPAAVSLL